MFRRKINFYRHPLKVCEIAVITSRNVLQRGHSYTDWRWKYKIESHVIKEAILAHYDQYFWYEPKKGTKKLYPFGHGNGVIGTIFVKKQSDYTIEEDPRICLTEKEKRTGWISFERIKELEDEINYSN